MITYIYKASPLIVKIKVKETACPNACNHVIPCFKCTNLELYLKQKQEFLIKMKSL